jgi:hypothetical protein
MIRHSSVESLVNVLFLGLLDVTVAVETPLHPIFSAVVLTLDWMPPILGEEGRWWRVPVPRKIGESGTKLCSSCCSVVEENGPAHES